MVRVASKFTPEVLIEAPRRGPAVPNATGTLALYTVSTHTIGEETVKEVRVIDIASGWSSQLVEGDKVHDTVWLGVENLVVYLKSGEKGATQVLMADAAAPYVPHNVLAEIPAPVQALKVKSLEDGTVAFVVVGLVGDDGELYNDEAQEKKTTIRVFDKFHVREWDAYRKPQRHSLWYSRIVRTSKGNWKLEPLKDALANTGFEAPQGMYGGEGAGNFDLWTRGILFVAEDPDNKIPHYDAASGVYFVILGTYDGASFASVQKVSTKLSNDLQYCSNPRFSPDGTMVGFLVAAATRRQDTKLYISRLVDSSVVSVLHNWELIPDAFEFSADSRSVFIQAQERGRVLLYRAPVAQGKAPQRITSDGSISAFYPLIQGDSDELLVTRTSLTESSLYQIISLKGKCSTRVVSSASKHGLKLGLSPKQVSEIVFPGAGDYDVQAWVTKPSDFDSDKKYPLAMLIHGGPESSWSDAWSTRWNPAVWAEQGYIVVCPNPTGSTGFGLDFTERIYGSWGGYPYEDIVKCTEFVAKNIPNVDMSRAICAGGSYGGYMMNWINGNPLGRKFKALVSHDSVFNLPSFFLQTDVGGWAEDFVGSPLPWKNIENLEKWNPARPDLLPNWKTPMLVIHSDQDFRCPITEGLAAYNTLQALRTPSRFVNFPDENHFVLKEENSLAWHREVFRWINHWSGIARDEVLAEL